MKNKVIHNSIQIKYVDTGKKGDKCAIISNI